MGTTVVTDLFYFMGIIVTVGLFLFFFFRGKKSNQIRHYSPQLLFTPAERNFLFVLDEVIKKKGSDYRVFGKVRIADIIKPSKHLPKKMWNKLFWAISSKHVDYLLVDRESLEPILAIELNDKSHKRKDRMGRDEMVGKAFASAKIPLLWVKASRRYNRATLLSDIQEKISKRGSL